MLNLTRCSALEPLLSEEQIRQFERWRLWRRTELRVMEIQYSQHLQQSTTQDMLVRDWTEKRKR